MIIDFHIHPNYSHDAEDISIDKYAQKAAGLGINALAFTTHMDLSPAFTDKKDAFVRVNNNLVHVSEDWLPAYMVEIKQAAEKYKKQVKIFTGIEITYEPYYEHLIRDKIKGYEFDYVLGAVHNIADMPFDLPDTYEKCFAGKSFQQFCIKYFGIITKLAESRIATSIAHLDSYKRYGIKYYGEESFKKLPEGAEQALKAIVRNNCIIEINCSGFRHGVNEPYPSDLLLSAAVDCGLKYVAVGSDTHKYDLLCQNIDKAEPLIKKYNLQKIII